MACLSSTRILLARQQTSENEQTKAYVRTTVIGMGGASRNHRYKKFSRATVFVASVTRPSKLYCFNRGVWPGEEASKVGARFQNKTSFSYFYAVLCSMLSGVALSTIVKLLSTRIS